jgi:hypothetical protein
LRSAREQACIDADGNPVPWYTYPALEYLRQLDWRDRSVFEYGSGNSTIFWSRIAKRLVSVESDVEWAQRVRPQLPQHCELLYHPQQKDYVGALSEPFDVVVVDGEWRFDCAQQARQFLSPRGLIILDNSDWHPRTAEFLRSCGLLQVDFTGLGPINPYSWTTSIFFARDFEIRPAHERQPWPGVGAIVKVAAE